MRRSGIVAVAAAMGLAFSVPAWTETARRSDTDRVANAKAGASAKASAHGQKPCAGKPRAEAGKAQAQAFDTLVVPASADHPGFTMVGENVTYADPSFVPYKLREAARRARANADLAKIP